jgi:hypothetical protein
MTKKVIDGTTHLYDEFAGWSFHAIIGETTEFVVSNGTNLSVIVNKFGTKSEIWKDSRVFFCNGDYFESLNPSGKAQKAWNNFKNACIC